MGSLASGELSDTTIYHLVGKPFTLDPRVQREFGVAHYGRFRDDGIICFLNTTSNTRLRFVQRMQDLAVDYELTAEVADTDNIEMLDVSFFRGRMFDDHGVLDYRLFSKPSSVWRPLSQLSGHPSRVHQFWPRLQLRRIRKGFSCPAQARRAQEEFRRKMFSASGYLVFRATTQSADSAPLDRSTEWWSLAGFTVSSLLDGDPPWSNKQTFASSW